MKKILTVHEFKKYCETHKPSSIYFLTENQDWYNTFQPCKLDLSFTGIRVSENPNMVYLHTGGDSMLIKRIRRAEIDTDRTLLGTLYTVFCGGGDERNRDITYRLIAR